jgi:hypothetical protein
MKSVSMALPFSFLAWILSAVIGTSSIGEQVLFTKEDATFGDSRDAWLLGIEGLTPCKMGG